MYKYVYVCICLFVESSVVQLDYQGCNMCVLVCLRVRRSMYLFVYVYYRGCNMCVS